MPAFESFARRALPLAVLGAVLVPHTLACGARTVPHSEVSLAQMDGRVDVRIAMDASTRASVLTFDGLWSAPSRTGSGDEVPSLDECPSLPADTRITVSGQPATLSRGGWREMQSGGCDRDQSVTTYDCTAPLARVAWSDGDTIVVTQGGRTWTVVLADAPHATRATFAKTPVDNDGVAAVSLTPALPLGADVSGTLTLSDCQGRVWSVTPPFASTGSSVSAPMPRVVAPARRCAGDLVGARDGGRDVDASLDAAADAEANADVDMDAGVADTDGGQDAATGLELAAALEIRFPTRIARCEGPRSCALRGEAAIDAYATAPFRLAR